MSDLRPEQLIYAEELLYNGKVEEALEIIMNFEKKGELTPKDQLSVLLLKGWIYWCKTQMKDAVEVGELAYSMSQELGLVPESIEALNLRALIWFLGNVDKALSLILEAEKLLNSLSDESSANIFKLKSSLTFSKSWIYFHKSDFNIALDLALEALTLGEKIKNNVIVGYNLILIGYIYMGKGELDTALEYAMKSLKFCEKLDFQVQIAYILCGIGRFYYLKGGLNRALEFCKKSLSIGEITNMIKVNTLSNIGFIYRDRGELNKALKYTKQSTKLAEEVLGYYFMIINKRNMGEIYRKKGESGQAIKYFEQSLVLSEKIGSTLEMIYPLLCLLLITLDNNSHEQAHQYLKRLENLSDQNENTIFKQGYSLGKALMLKSSSRMRDKVKAEGLLKQIVKDDIVYPQFHILSIVTLCDLLLEELFTYNNLGVLDEINPLITQLLKIAENQHSFSWLGEGKLLQAKLALIQINIEEAKKLLTEAQRITELHRLQLLARKISSEHDLLLEQLEEWQALRSRKPLISDRIKLASIDEVISRLQGTRAVAPPELIDEVPVLLLIIAEGGVPAFSNSFTGEWSFEDGKFSNFLTAFNTFSEEVFSKGLDRAKFGEYMLIMDSVGSFSVCYLFKGQSYVAKQKLIQFAHRVQNTTSIWRAFEDFHKTHQTIILTENPPLESLITEIFTSKS